MTKKELYEIQCVRLMNDLLNTYENNSVKEIINSEMDFLKDFDKTTKRNVYLKIFFSISYEKNPYAKYTFEYIGKDYRGNSLNDLNNYILRKKIMKKEKDNDMEMG